MRDFPLSGKDLGFVDKAVGKRFILVSHRSGEDGRPWVKRAKGAFYPSTSGC
jgi:hypothetical protein